MVALVAVIAGAGAGSAGAVVLGPQTTLDLETTPGMAGQVQVLASAFPTAAHGVVLFEQCEPCQARSGRYHDWVAVTDNSGHSWTVRRTPLISAFYYPGMVFANARDGWAEGNFVTHDGGLTWRQAHIPADLLSVESVSTSGGRVWALTQQDSGPGKAVVLTGSAAGDTLVPAASQPVAGGWIIAGSQTTAYADNAASYRPPSSSTDNGGRSWHRLGAVCPPGHRAATGLFGAYHGDLLQTCLATRLRDGVPKINPEDHTEVISRSTDGGLRWQAEPNPRFVFDPRPVSATTAWATCDIFDVCRSSDDGATWTVVWRHSVSPPLSYPAALTAPSPLDAEEVVVVSPASGTYLVVYSTTDGGQRWQSTAVPLPTG